MRWTVYSSQPDGITKFEAVVRLNWPHVVKANRPSARDTTAVPEVINVVIDLQKPPQKLKAAVSTVMNSYREAPGHALLAGHAPFGTVFLDAR